MCAVVAGNERDAAELERLRRHNITYVLNVTAHVPQYWHAHGIRYKRIPASDSAQQNLKQYFEEAIEYIGKSVLTTSLLRYCCCSYCSFVYKHLFYFIILLFLLFRFDFGCC